VVVKYRTIVADPPWPYPEGFARNKGGRYGDGTNGSEIVPLPYQSMTLTEIHALPVGALSLEDAWLYLWTTNRYLREAFDVAHAWGFAYGQTVVWHKNDGHPRFPAVVAPNRAEYILVCKRGAPERLQPWASNVIEIPFNPARLSHSQKPEAFLDLIEQVSPGPYLELFARRQRLGWDTWGNEALEHVEMSA
jgi:N6-adenosine-specific RNA methylase IME4